MDVLTARFGKLSVSQEDVLTFEQGMIGLRGLREWIVLTDSHNPSLGWLQAIDAADTAFGVVNPRRFVTDYQVRLGARDLSGLRLAHLRDASVAVIVNRGEKGVTLNLRAPLVINVEQRTGCQVVVRDPYPVQYKLSATDIRYRKSA